MKLTILIVIVSILNCFSTETYSQTTKLTITENNSTLLNVLRAIEEQSEFKFFYNEKVDVNRSVSVTVDQKPIADILDKVLASTSVKYKVIGRQIALYDKDEMEPFMSEQLGKKVAGRVTDKSGAPIPGVTIAIKGTTQGTITDSNGNYAISNVPAQATLMFSFIGMKGLEIVVGAQSVYDVTMVEETIALDEVIAIGYGTVRKADLTGSVTRVEAKSFQNQVITSVGQAFAGTVAGVNTIQSTNASGNSKLEVRGPTSLSAGTTPLVVIDGAIFYGTLSELNPSDIATIDILKDASAAAVYGAKAASGVVLVTTKRGVEGKPIINFTTKAGISEITNRNYHPYYGKDYLKYKGDYFRTSGSAATLPDYYWDDPDNLRQGVTLDQWRTASNNPASDNIDEWGNRLSLYPIEKTMLKNGTTTNWMDQVLQLGFNQDYDMSISGATKNINYYWSVGYVDNNGIIVGDRFKALRSRLNLEFNVTNWLKAGMNTQFALRDESSVPASFGDIPYISPYSVPFDADGKPIWYPYGETYGVNPLINHYNQKRLRKMNSLFASLYAEVKLPFGIKYRVQFQPNIYNSKYYDFYGVDTPVGATSHQGGYGTRLDNSSIQWMIDHTIKWNKEIGKHNFDLTLLYNAEESKGYQSNYSNQKFSPTDALGFSGMQFGTIPSVSSYDDRYGGNSYMARLNYIFAGKYLLTATVRRDGFSAFGQKNPTATFPGVSVAWKISDEKFFNVDFINRMKLKLGWGVNGNRDIGTYSALAQLSSNMYSTGSSVVMGTYTRSLANANLRWEKTTKLNAALEIGLLKDRIDLTVEYYDWTTNDLLMTRQIPQISGFSNIMANLGELSNKGFELTMNTENVNKTNFSWRSSLVFSMNRNKINRLFGNMETVTVDGKTVTREIPDYSNRWFPGQSIDVIWDYKFTGIWQTSEKDAAAAFGQKPGDIKVLDVNKDGKYTALQDKMFLGNYKPKFRLGLRNDFDFLKKFTASVFVRADLGQIASVPNLVPSMPDRLNNMEHPHWTPTDPNNEWPSLGAVYSAFGGGIALWQPISFVRIQDFSLAYTLPQSVAKKIQIGNVRFIASIRNLATFTKWKFFDPEAQGSPMPRTYTLGVNVTL